MDGTFPGPGPIPPPSEDATVFDPFDLLYGPLHTMTGENENDELKLGPDSFGADSEGSISSDHSETEEQAESNDMLVYPTRSSLAPLSEMDQVREICNTISQTLLRERLACRSTW